MLKLRAADSRGHIQQDWLDTWHSFSFGDYHDPDYMGFASLRVINEDFIAPHSGFPTHPHRHMEIITYLIGGALQHRDNMGNESVIHAGDVQYMSAASGVLHSEINPGDQPTHLLQIWLRPDRLLAEPGYAQKHFSTADKAGRWCLLVSPDGRSDSIGVSQDAFIYASILEPEQSLTYCLPQGRVGYLQLIRGVLSVGDRQLHAGDALSVDHAGDLLVTGLQSAEFLWFDLAA